MKEFLECVNEFDFLYFSETWTNDLNVPVLDGYCKPFFKNRKRKRTGKRDSGGLCFYVKKKFIQGVQEVFWDFEDGMLFKLDKDFFRIRKGCFFDVCLYEK